jgi:predicted secreted protein
MAQAQTVRFSGLRVLLGDGATPSETFTAPCGLTERSLSLAKEFGETNVPDCTDEDAASWTERDVTSKSASIDGTGVLDIVSLVTWQARFDSDTSGNVRTEIWRAGAKVGHWQGAFHLETFEVSGTKGERASAKVSLQSDGVVVWTAA